MSVQILNRQDLHGGLSRLEIARNDLTTAVVTVVTTELDNGGLTEFLEAVASEDGPTVALPRWKRP